MTLAIYDDGKGRCQSWEVQCLSLEVKTLVMPRIGCGLDKLEWSKVKEMIKDVFKDTDINIEVYYL